MNRTVMLVFSFWLCVGGSVRGEGIPEEGKQIVDPDSLDTGKYRAVVILDSTDKRKIQGFFHLAQVFSVRMDGRPNPRALPNLVEAVNEYTSIEVDLTSILELGSRELRKAPWIFLAPEQTISFADYEIKNLGKYFEEGGFLLADAGLEIGSGRDVFIRQAIKDALNSVGARTRFRRLRQSHPIYHCFFDFDGPPPAIVGGVGGVGRGNPDYLIGVELGRRLVAVISYQNLAATWENMANSTDTARHLQFGINTIVFALTQEGGITRKFVGSGEFRY